MLMIPKSSSEEEGNLRKRLKSVSRIAIISEDARMSAYKGKNLKRLGRSKFIPIRQPSLTGYRKRLLFMA